MKKLRKEKQELEKGLIGIVKKDKSSKFL